MWEPEGPRSSRRQAMIGRARAVEDATELVIPFDAGDAIEVKNSSVSCEAGPNGGVGIGLRPLYHLSETLPVRFVRQIWGQRFPAGHDQAVNLPVPQIFHTGIAAVQVVSGGLLPG